MKNTHTYPIFYLLLIFVTISQAQFKQPANKPSDSVRDQSSIHLDSTWSDFNDKKTESITVNYAPETITRTIIEDSKDNIWIASWQGVFKFNGVDFEHITKEVSDARFFTVMEDSQNKFWFGSIGSGVYHYDGQSFQNYTIKNGLIDDQVTNIYEDHAGHIWIGTEGGISIFNGSTFTHLTTDEGLPDNRVNSVIQDDNGKYWIGTSGQAAIYDPQFKTFTTIENTDGQSFENVRQIIKSSKGGLWLAGNDGFWRYNNQNFVQYSEDFTGYVFEDSSGNILTSSHGQSAQTWVLNIFKDSSIYPMQMVQEKGMIFGISKDAKEHIWYGTLNGLKRHSDGTIYHYQVK
jgi:ligand-binding sensor domain-containing protein